MGVQVVRKASTPPFSEADSICPVAILAREADVLAKARSRLCDGAMVAFHKEQEAKGKDNDAHYTAACRRLQIDRMQDTLKERLDTIQKSVSMMLAKSPEGAQYQLSQLFHIAQIFSCGEEYTEGKGGEYLTRMHGLALALRTWFQTNYRLPPNEAEKWEFAGIIDAHKTLEAALKFDGGEIMDDDAI